MALTHAPIVPIGAVIWFVDLGYTAAPNGGYRAFVVSGL
jgi:hypothetical protein